MDQLLDGVLQETIGLINLLFTILLIIPGLLALGLGLRTLTLWLKARRIAELPVTRMGQLPPGFVKVQGRVMNREGEGLLVAPLSRQSGVYYKCTVTRHRTKGFSLFNQQQAQPVLLQDDSGSLWVDLAEAEVHTPRTEYVGYQKELPKHVQQFLEEQGIQDNWYQLRVVEAVIPSQAMVTVLGTVSNTLPRGSNPERYGGTHALVRGKKPKLLIACQEGEATFYPSLFLPITVYGAITVGVLGALAFLWIVGSQWIATLSD